MVKEFLTESLIIFFKAETQKNDVLAGTRQLADECVKIQKDFMIIQVVFYQAIYAASRHAARLPAPAKKLLFLFIILMISDQVVFTSAKHDDFF